MSEENSTPVRRVAAGGNLSFEDFEALEEAKSEQLSLAAEKEVALEESKEEVKEKREIDQLFSDDTEEEEASSEVEEDGESEETEEGEETEKPADAAPAKLVTAKAGKEKIEIPADATFLHKVDGKRVVVKLQELLNDYSGRKTWEKEFKDLGEFKQERHRLEAEKKEITAFVQNLDNRVKQGDGLNAIVEMISSFGGDALEFTRTLRNQLLEASQRYAEMSEEERKILEAQEESEYYKKRYASFEEQRAQEAARQRLETQIDQAVKSNNIPNRETFGQAYRELVNYVNTGQIPVSALADGQAVGVSDVVAYYKHMQGDNELKAVIQEVNPSLLNDPDAVQELRELKQWKNATKEELQEVIRELYGSKEDSAARNLSEKVRKGQSSRQRKVESKPATSVDPGLDWDAI